jgi:hypothetical protein
MTALLIRLTGAPATKAILLAVRRRLLAPGEARQVDRHGRGGKTMDKVA